MPGYEVQTRARVATQPFPSYLYSSSSSSNDQLPGSTDHQVPAHAAQLISNAHATGGAGCQARHQPDQHWQLQQPQ